MDWTKLLVDSSVGVVAILIVSIFVRHIGQLVHRIIPDGFRLLRDEMRVAHTAAEKRHKEHMDGMRRIEASLDRQEGEQRRRSAARAKGKGKNPPPRSQRPTKPR